jgi:hypothetical protein
MLLMEVEILSFSTAHTNSHYPTNITNTFSYLIVDGEVISKLFGTPYVKHSSWSVRENKACIRI